MDPQGGSAELATRTAARFATTDWSLVLAAGGSSSPAADRSFEVLCRTYWLPVHAFIRRESYAPTDAEDRSRVVWTGTKPSAQEKGYSLRLYLSTIENPRPQEVVPSRDYISAMSDSAPFLVALTVER